MCGPYPLFNFQLSQTGYKVVNREPDRGLKYIDRQKVLILLFRFLLSSHKICYQTTHFAMCFTSPLHPQVKTSMILEQEFSNCIIWRNGLGQAEQHFKLGVHMYSSLYSMLYLSVQSTVVELIISSSLASGSCSTGMCLILLNIIKAQLLLGQS